jgi:hypothetical protein
MPSDELLQINELVKYGILKGWMHPLLCAVMSDSNMEAEQGEL